MTLKPKKKRKFKLKILTGENGILVIPEKSDDAILSFESWLKINTLQERYDKVGYYRFFLKKGISESTLLQLANDFDVKYEKEWERKEEK